MNPQDQQQSNPQEELNADQIASALSFATYQQEQNLPIDQIDPNTMEDMSMDASQTPQDTPQPEEQPEVEEPQEPVDDPRFGELETKMDDIRKEVADTIRKEMSGIRDEIRKSLND